MRKMVVQVAGLCLQSLAGPTLPKSWHSTPQIPRRTPSCERGRTGLLTTPLWPGCWCPPPSPLPMSRVSPQPSPQTTWPPQTPIPGTCTSLPPLRVWAECPGLLPRVSLGAELARPSLLLSSPTLGPGSFQGHLGPLCGLDLPGGACRQHKDAPSFPQCPVPYATPTTPCPLPQPRAFLAPSSAAEAPTLGGGPGRDGEPAQSLGQEAPEGKPCSPQDSPEHSPAPSLFLPGP